MSRVRKNLTVFLSVLAFVFALGVGVLPGFAGEAEQPDPPEVEELDPAFKPLQTLVDSAKAKNLTNYTQETADAVTKAVEAAEALIKSGDKAEAGITEKKDALSKAVEALKPKPDPWDLFVKLQTARQVSSADVSVDYMKELQSAITEAEGVLVDPKMDESRITNATKKLDAVLRKKSSDSGPATFYTKDGDTIEPPHKQKEIRDYVKSSAIKDFDGSNIPTKFSIKYKTPPSWTSPFSAGELSQETLNVGLAALNAHRFVAGVEPVRLVTDAQAVKNTQAGAMVQAYLGAKGHSIEQAKRPADMDQTLFNNANTGLDQSIVASHSGGSNFNIPQMSSSLVNDVGVSPLGHRLSALSSSLKGVCFGAASSPSSEARVLYNVDVDVDGQAFSGLKGNEKTYAWPAQNTPVEFFDSQAWWSLMTPNLTFWDEEYLSLGDNEKLINATITSSYGTSWSGNSKAGTFGLENSKQVLSSRSHGDSIVMKTSGLTVHENESFLVKISGEWFDSFYGGPLEYQVNFFSLFDHSIDSLQEYAKELENVLSLTPVSKDGSDVLPGLNWVTQEQLDGLSQTYLDVANYFKNITDITNDKLNGYYNTFDAVFKSVSTRNGAASPVDPALTQKQTELTSLIRECETLATASVSKTLDRFGNSVDNVPDKGQYVDDKAALTTFQQAITKAKGLQSSGDLSTLTKALSDLKSAKATFEPHLKTADWTSLKTEIGQLLSSSGNLADDVSASSDGGELVNGKKYAESGLLSSFSSAKEALQAKKDQVDVTGKALKDAKAAFESAKSALQQGIKTVDVSSVVAQINKAKEALNSLVEQTTESASENGVASGTYWAPSSAMSAAREAVKAANTAASTSLSTLTLNTAKQALAAINAAKSTFESARAESHWTPPKPQKPEIVDALKGAIDAAKAAKNGVTKTNSAPSENGTRWATEEAFNTFDAAIAAAEEVYGTENAKTDDWDDAGLQAAKSTLEAAKGVFEGAIQTVRVVPPEVAALKSAIDAANTYKSGVTRSNTEPELAGTKWATESDYDTFVAAIATAQGVWDTENAKGTDADADACRAAKEALEAAKSAFEATVKTVSARPSLSATVRADRAVAQPGDVITWTVSVSESGLADASNVLVTPDWKDAKLEEKTEAQSVADGLSAGATKEVTFTAKVAATAVSGDEIKPSFAVTADRASGVSAEGDAVRVALPTITLKRTLEPANAKAGSDVTVKVTVTNAVSGTVARNVKVTDAFLEGVSAKGDVKVTRAGTDAEGVSAASVSERGATVTIASVEGGGESYVVEYKVTVDAGKHDGDTIEGSASATSDNVADIVNASATLRVSDVALSVTGKTETMAPEDGFEDTQWVQAGETLRWSGQISSSGSSAPSAVTVKGSVPSFVEVTKIDVNGSVVASANLFESTVSPWEDGATFEVTGKVKEGASLGAGAFTLNVEVDGHVAATYSSESSVVEPKVTVTRKLADGQSAWVQPGDTVKYVTEVEETQEHAYAKTVKVVDSLPIGLTGQAGTIEVTGVEGATKEIADGTATVTLPLLKKGDKAKITYDAKVAENASAGTLSNTCVVTGVGVSAAPAGVDVSVEKPSVSVTFASDNPKTWASGESKDVKLTVRVTSEHAELRGGVVFVTPPSEGFTVEEKTAPGSEIADVDGKIKVTLAEVLKPGASVDVTLKLKANEGWTGTGVISVSVTGDGVNYTSDLAQGQVSVLGEGLSVLKSESSSRVSIGDTVDCSVVVSLAGTDTTDVVVRDTLPEGLRLVGEPELIGPGVPAKASTDPMSTIALAASGSGATVKKIGDNGWELTIPSMEDGDIYSVNYQAEATAEGKLESTLSYASTDFEEKTETMALVAAEPGVSLLLLNDVSAAEGREVKDDQGRVLIAPGEKVTFTALATSDGTEGSVNDLTLKLQLPEKFSFDGSAEPSVKVTGKEDASLSAMKNDGERSASVVIDELSAGETVELVVPAIAKDDFQGAEGTVKATLSGEALDEEKSVETKVASYDPVLEVTKTVDNQRAKTGDEITYTITLTQTKASTFAKAVKLVDTVPSGIDIKQAPEEEKPKLSSGETVEWKEEGRTLEATIEKLEAGKPVTLTYKATVSGEPSSEAPLKNTVKVTSATVSGEKTAEVALTGCVHEWEATDNDGYVHTKDATCQVEGEETRTCKLCGFKEVKKTGLADHNYVQVVTAHKDASCTDGYTVKSYKCSMCGKFEHHAGEVANPKGLPGIEWGIVEELPATGEHRLGEPVTQEDDKAATCTEAGRKHTITTCLDCHQQVEEVNQEILALGHQLKDVEFTDDEHQRLEATCGADGYYWTRKQCGRCPEVPVEDNEPVQHVIQKTAKHVWGEPEYETTEEPKCGVAGHRLKKLTCTVCHEKMEETEVIPPLSHDFGDGWKDDPENTAICEKAGRMVRSCTRPDCGHTEYQDKPALGHIEAEKVEYKKAPTCTEPGVQYRIKYCSREGCNKELDRVEERAEALGHHIVLGEGTDTATHTEGGEITYELKCDRDGCTLGDLGKKVLPSIPLGHVWSESGTCDADQAKKPGEDHQHTWSEWVTIKPALCDESGLAKRYCTECFENDSETLEVAAAGHDWEVTREVTQEPLCGKAGFAIDHGVCKVCAATKDTPVELDALEHVPGETSWETVLEPTCTAEGRCKGTIKCTLCDAVLDDTLEESIPMVAHTFGEDGVCEVCGALKQDNCEHVFGDWEEVTPPTCTEPGKSSRRCSECGFVEEREEAALGHVASPNVITQVLTESTCTRHGSHSETTVCERCGEVMGEPKTVQDPVLGHDYENGQCTRCGAVDPLFGAPLEGIDKQALSNLLDKASVMDQSRYTSASWQNLVDALADAEAIVNSASASQAEVDAAAAKVRQAIEALVPLSGTALPPSSTLVVNPNNQNGGSGTNSGGSSSGGGAGGSSSGGYITNAPVSVPGPTSTGGTNSGSASSGGSVSNSQTSNPVYSKMADTGVMALGAISLGVASASALAFIVRRHKKD